MADKTMNIKPTGPTANHEQAIQLVHKENNAPGQTYRIAEVSGIVTTVNFTQSRGDPTRFKIHCPNMGKTFEAVCDLFCPIRQGDTIYALCMVGNDGKLYVSKQPFVQPAIDRDSMIQFFMRALRKGYGLIDKLYRTVSRVAGGDDRVIPFLTNIAQSWNDTRNSDVLFVFDGVEPDDVKKLLNWWHKERNLRRLYLFGITKTEINACRMTCDDIYLKCMCNPYTVPAIPLEKCDRIQDILNKRPQRNDRFRGEIIRFIWKNLHESGWTGTPTRLITRQFPGVKEHVEELKANYGMVAEMETAYLLFPHKVEKWIANYMITKRQSDHITYETPLDQRITIENGKVIERHSAHFNRQLSEDQQRAIQGALDHSICIITGGAGCGKCCALGTEILMFDGSIRKIETIKEGELLMGPDSQPRKVLSKCYGIDNLFEVFPSKGRSFVCNGPHVLTLKGLEPYIGLSNDREKCNIVTYSEKGYTKRKEFSTKEEAQTFISSLSEDIFDLPLNEYTLRSANYQKCCYLFHVGVVFPHKTVPMDSYLIGYWLGDVHIADNVITTNDAEIVEEFYNVLENYDMTLYKSHNPMKYYIRGKGDDQYKSNKFLDALRELDILNNKHIPDIYKINSREVRLKLLAGLIDSDGYVYQGCIEITKKNKRFADDIEYLAFSLGFMVTRVECEKVSEYKGKMKNSIYQIITIFGEGIENIPVILARNRSSPEEIKKRATFLRFQVKPVGKGMYCGFTLDGDGRYLHGDFLVTHNTTCLGQIINNLELRGIPYAVCSFTGKAVARIREVTNKRNPATMHRLISNTRKNQLDKRSNKFEKDIPLTDYEHVIIDEASTVTTELLYDFLQAYPNIQKLTLIGDVNQLLPIGWGSLLQQLLKSETIPTYKLTTNYRVYTDEGQRDGIIMNANAIVTHDPIYPFEFVPTTNFSVIEGPIERVYDIVRACFAGGVKADQLVIVTPYNRSLHVLNRSFQDIYNVGARSVTDSRGVKWMIGDRVMLTDNDQEIGVFNGESGTIIDVTEKAILVRFGQSGLHEFLLEPTHLGRISCPQVHTNHSYRRRQQLDEVLDGGELYIDEERTVKRLLHSYALTVDKSQGSEWDFVIVYIPEFNTGSFLNRNRIYTAITRSKRAVWCVVTDTDAFNVASVKYPPYRCENLCRRLKNTLPDLKPFIIKRNNKLEMKGDVPIIPEENIPEDITDNGFDCDDFE